MKIISRTYHSKYREMNKNQTYLTLPLTFTTGYCCSQYIHHHTIENNDHYVMVYVYLLAGPRKSRTIYLYITSLNS